MGPHENYLQTPLDPPGHMVGELATVTYSRQRHFAARATVASFCSREITQVAPAPLPPSASSSKVPKFPSQAALSRVHPRHPPCDSPNSSRFASRFWVQAMPSWSAKTRRPPPRQLLEILRGSMDVQHDQGHAWQ